MSASVLLTVLFAVAAPLPEPKPANERYGDAVVAILKAPTRVEVFRLRPSVPLRRPVQQAFGGYAIIAVGAEQGEAAAVALGKTILEDARVMTPPAVNFFLPWIGFRVWKDKENVEVLLDPQNHNLQVIGHDAEGKVLKQVLNVAQPATFNALVKRAQEAFPDDVALKQIQAVAEK